jgi:hypothetical protein
MRCSAGLAPLVFVLGALIRTGRVEAVRLKSSAENSPLHTVNLRQKNLEGEELPDGRCRQRLLADTTGASYTTDFYISGAKQRAIFDTGSFDTVVMGKDCSSCRGATYSSRESPTFFYKDGKKSTDVKKGELTTTAEQAAQDFKSSGYGWLGRVAEGVVKKSFNNDRIGKDFKYVEEMQYGSGPVMVIPGIDNVEVPGCGGKLKGEGFPIKEILDHQIPILKFTDALTSIVGMGPYMPSEADKRLHHLLGVDRYTFCVPREKTGDGSLIWNDKIPTGSDVQELRVIPGQPHWLVNLTEVTIRAQNGSKIGNGCTRKSGNASLTGCGALLDSGTSLLVGPSEIISEILPHVRVESDCSNMDDLQPLEINMENEQGKTVTYKLEPKDYVMQRNGSCKTGISIMQIQLDMPHPIMILGDTFMRKYYSVFNHETNSVGFAEANHDV